MQYWLAVILAAIGAALAGCNQAGDPNSSTVTTASGGKSVALKRYSAVDLPVVDPPLPPMDGGRVALSPPVGWRLLPRDSDYLVRLVKGEGENSLPRITVKAEPAPTGVPDVTEERVSEFVAAMEKRSAAVSGRRLLEPERPIVIGDYAWSRHVRQLRARGSSSGLAAVQSLTTVRHGRLYTIELTVESPGESSNAIAEAVLAHRDAAYALAAHWKFIGPAAEPTTAASPPENAEPDAAESPAEKTEDPRSTEKNPEKDAD